MSEENTHDGAVRPAQPRLVRQAMLPGLEPPPEDTVLEGPPPVARFLSDDAAPSVAPAHACPAPTARRAFAYAVAAGLAAGVGLAAAHRLIAPRTVVETVREEVRFEPDGIPTDLLPTAEDALAWETVAEMQGRIADRELKFHRGRATSGDGRLWKVMLDFYGDGRDTYARVTGDGKWVVKVDAHGRIVRAFRAPKADKSLRALLGAR